MHARGVGFLLDTHCWLWLQTDRAGPAHALTAAALPLHHRDPFDRMLVAQAQVEGLTLVTADNALELYDVRMVRAGTG